MIERNPGSTLVRPGAALKAFRTERGMTLSEVGEATGLPVSTLSKIENGKMDLTIDKLLRISLALDINVADVFGSPSGQFDSGGNSKRRSVTPAGAGKMVVSKNGDYRYQAYDLLQKEMTPIVAEIRAGNMEEFGDYHRHHGEEFVYVLEGELALYSDTYTPLHLKKGDSVYFDAAMAHAYIRVGNDVCRILSVFSSSEAHRVDLVEGQALLSEFMKRSADKAVSQAPPRS